MMRVLVIAVLAACQRDETPPPRVTPGTPGDLPVECEVYQRKLDELRACPSVSPELRSDLAVRLAEARASWESHRDTPRFARMCAGAITALAQVDCKPR